MKAPSTRKTTPAAGRREEVERAVSLSTADIGRPGHRILAAHNDVTLATPHGATCDICGAASKKPETIEDEVGPLPDAYFAPMERTDKTTKHSFVQDYTEAPRTDMELPVVIQRENGPRFHSGVVHSQVGSDARSTSPLMQPTPGSTPVLEARLIDDPTIYDALQVPGRSWWERNQKHIFVGVVLLMVGALVAVVVVLLGRQEPEPIKPEPAMLFYADEQSDRCNSDPSGRPNLRQRMYETLEECCELE